MECVREEVIQEAVPASIGVVIPQLKGALMETGYAWLPLVHIFLQPTAQVILDIRLVIILSFLMEPPRLVRMFQPLQD